MKNSLVAAALAVTLVTAADVSAQNPQATERNVIMRRKLEHSQKILEGLAIEDFEMVRQNAKVMNTFSQLEKWYHADDRQYRAQLNIFLYANDEIARMAEAKNLEGASLAYTQLTLSCVNCHKHIRAQKK
ncbi:MAG: hypothetical protein HY000_09245 [Planctomycetes bacterium]|nr:hypothetical protein [Planctomycetota bacterium]